jgi:hypothetical protein
MDVGQVIEICEACGDECLQTGRTHWLIRRNRTAISIPTLENVYPTREDIKEVFSHGVKVLRFNTTGPWPPMACEFVLNQHPYTLEMIHQKARNQVRRGLERCAVRRPKQSELMRRAFEINARTVERQDRRSNLTDKNCWENYIAKLLSVPDVFFYGAYVDDFMVAYVLVLVILKKIVLYHPFMDREYSKSYPMNALIFSAVNQTREKVGPLQVSYGFGSIWNIDTLDHFKIRMGFERISRLRITLVKGLWNYALTRAVSKVFSATPVVNRKIGQKYQRLVEEKEVGLKWWQNPTTADDSSRAEGT